MPATRLLLLRCRPSVSYRKEAVSHVQSGNRIVFTHACGEAQALTEELVRQADRLENVEIVHMVAMGKAPYCQPGMEKHFRHNALFVGGSTRNTQALYGWYITC